MQLPCAKRMASNATMNVELPGQWIDATKQNPDQWAGEQWGGEQRINGHIKIRLHDGREIYTWWKDGQWSVERIKPHLKVAFWERPKIIA